MQVAKLLSEWIVLFSAIGLLCLIIFTIVALMLFGATLRVLISILILGAVLVMCEQIISREIVH